MMRDSKKTFILIEMVLAVIVVIMAGLMVKERKGRETEKISVIIQNPDGSQWTAFKYGLKMASEDQDVLVSVVSREESLTVEDELSVIEQEISGGADAILIQPIPGKDSENALKKYRNKVPIMLIESTVSEDSQDSLFPVTAPDNYAMGQALARELLEDHSGNIRGKTLGILMEAENSQAVLSRKQGLKDALKDEGGMVSWCNFGNFSEAEGNSPGNYDAVDFVIALDDRSLTAAGESSAANNLHGAVVYGVGRSTEALYYLDTGYVECLVVPDEFNMGYQSLTESVEALRHFFRKTQDKTVSHTVIRRQELFSKENQEILFTMSQ